MTVNYLGVEMTRGQRKWFASQVIGPPCKDCEFHTLWMSIVPGLFLTRGVDVAQEASEAIYKGHGYD